MATKMEQPVRNVTDEQIQTAIKAPHVMKTDEGSWNVREMGVKGRNKSFENKRSAVQYAHEVASRKGSPWVVVHEAEGKVEWQDVEKKGSARTE